MNHYGADHNFRINQLYSSIVANSIHFKPKGDKIIITLQKTTEGEEWLDLKTKSTGTIFNQLTRNQEKEPEVVFLSPFLSPGNSPK
ncbi:hypothetical protein K501DRAFT_329445 [Backusella circina FSU 941]|nr:hypothetical protein K501DRAFT_329445 [Backusella circina FSU 941]